MIKDLITEHTQPISRLAIDTSQRVHDFNPMVGNNGVTKIEAYNEFGEQDYIIWFAIYVEDEIVWRVNGKYVVEVGYGK